MKKMYIGNLCNGIEVEQGGGKNTNWYYRRRGVDSNGKWGEGFRSRREACMWACAEIKKDAEVGHAWAIELLRELKVSEKEVAKK